MGLWSTHATVEGIVLRAARHWSRDSNVINDPLGEPGPTPLYVGLPSAWGSLFRDTGRQMDRPLALEMKYLSPQGHCWGTQRGLPYLGLCGKDEFPGDGM